MYLVIYCSKFKQTVTEHLQQKASLWVYSKWRWLKFFWHNAGSDWHQNQSKRIFHYVHYNGGVNRVRNEKDWFKSPCPIPGSIKMFLSWPISKLMERESQKKQIFSTSHFFDLFQCWPQVKLFKVNLITIRIGAGFKVNPYLQGFSILKALSLNLNRILFSQNLMYSSKGHKRELKVLTIL